MKKYLLAAASLVALAAPAAAADMAARPMYTKAPPMVAAVYNWTGFYVCINGGGAFGQKCWNFVAFGGVAIAPPNGAGCQSPSGGSPPAVTAPAISASAPRSGADRLPMRWNKRIMRGKL